MSKPSTIEGLTVEQKVEAATALIDRADGILKRIAQTIRTCNVRHEVKGKAGEWHTVEESRLAGAMHLLDFLSEYDCSHLEDWYRDYLLLGGEHLVLTDDGWCPPDMAGQEEILDEINAPAKAKNE